MVVLLLRQSRRIVDVRSGRPQPRAAKRRRRPQRLDKPDAGERPAGRRGRDGDLPGDIQPADFARGYVDTGVVNSAPNNASSGQSYNINQSEQVTPTVKTENPDLVSVKRSGNSFLFEFDEALDEADVAENSSGLRLYFPEAKQNSTIPFASSSRVERVEGSRTTLRSFYQGTVPGGLLVVRRRGGLRRTGLCTGGPGLPGRQQRQECFRRAL